MSDPASISVVIPAYNAEVYIAETLRSVATQTLSPVEVIVVDDGSTDATQEIAEWFGAKVIQQCNQGPAAARNTGATNAVGRWIAFVDADDLWETNKLEAQYASLERAPDAKFSFCDYSQFDERGRVDASVLGDVHRFFKRVERDALGGDAYLYGGARFVASLHDQFYIMPSTVMIEREAMLECGGGFSRNFRTVEDHEFFLRFTRNHVGTYVDQPLVRYRRHADSLTADVAKMQENRLALADHVVSHPNDYRAETVAYFKKYRPKFIRNAGAAQLCYGDVRRCRELLRIAQSERFDGRAIFLLILVTLNSFFPVQRGCRMSHDVRGYLRSIRAALYRRLRARKNGARSLTVQPKYESAR